MNGRGLAVANGALALALGAWGVWLLGMAKGKPEYLAERLGDTTATCEWTALDDASMSTLGVSHEEHHSWTDRSTAYITFRAPALPAGGVVEFGVIAMAATPMHVRVKGQRARVRVDDGGLYTLPLMPSDAPGVQVMVLDSRLKPPRDGEQRWLGAALNRLRVCPDASGRASP